MLAAALGRGERGRGCGLTISVNGAASSDVDGRVVDHAWDFGDGTTGTGSQTGQTYAAAGTVNLAQLSLRLPEVDSTVALALQLMLLTVFGIKAAVFPLSFWLPDSYPTASAPVTAVFAYRSELPVSRYANSASVSCPPRQ